MLIALTGKAQSGKDTAASTLVAQLDYLVLPFAEPLKQSCMFKFGLSWNDVFTEEGKKTYIPAWGMTVGEILQQEGTEATKPYWGEDFWVKRWRMSYDAALEQGEDRIVVTDCRFNPEAQAITDLGGKIIHIIRPNAAPLEGRDPTHPSERGIDEKYITTTLVNDKGVRDLKRQVLALAREWQR